MSNGDPGESPPDFFAPPPFKADEALVGLRRALRDLKPLVEKGTGANVRFDWKAMPVIELSVEGAGEGGKPVIVAALARRPSQRPQYSEWTRLKLASGAEARKWLDDVRRALRRWDDED